MRDGYRIAFLTAFDARDVRTLSGTPYHAAKALERHCGGVTFLGPVPSSPLVTGGRVLNKLGHAVTGRRLDWLHSIGVARRWGRYFSSGLRSGGYDVVFAPFASTELAFLDTDLPVVYSTDATFARVHDYLTVFSRLWPVSVRSGHEVERRAIARADAIAYPTEWVARSAIDDYGAVRERIHVLPYGANLEEAPPRSVAEARAPHGGCRLLFLGIDWRGKGGPIALETLGELRRRGLNAELVVCGPRAHPAPGHAGVRFVPFLDKGRPADRAALDALFREADLLLVPTRADCYGLVFCEAAAYGLPSIATATGGVPDVVRDGVTGVLLPPSATGTEYAERIAELLGDPERYRAMALAARARFEEVLNWDAWGRAVRGVLDGLVG